MKFQLKTMISWQLAVGNKQEYKKLVSFLPTANCQLPTHWKFPELESPALKVHRFNNR